MPSLHRDDPLAKPYIPIDTDVVDNIEHYSSDRIHVHIDYKDRDGQIRQMRGYIADVYTTREKEEYLKMMDGRQLRLDQLVNVEAKVKGKTMGRDESLELEERLKITDNKFFPNGMA